MTRQRLNTPEAIQRGGFQGGVHVQAEQAPQGNSLIELAQSLSSLTGAVSRAGGQMVQQRADRLREIAPEEMTQVVEGELAGYNAQQIGEALETEPMLARFRENPYLLPLLRRHQGRTAAQEWSQRMAEEVDVRDPNAVQAWMEENTPELGDDRFVSAGFNEEAQRWRNQIGQLQLQEIVSDAKAARIDAYATDFRRMVEEHGAEAAFAGARENQSALEVSGPEASQAQLRVARAFAEAGDRETARAILETRRGDAPSLLQSGQYGADAEALLDTAELNWRQSNAERWEGEENGFRMRALQNDLTTQELEDFLAASDWPEERQGRMREFLLQAQIAERRRIETLRREWEAEQRAIGRENARQAQHNALYDLDTMLMSGEDDETIFTSEAWNALDTQNQISFRRRVETRRRTEAREGRTASATEWTENFEDRTLGNAISAAITGNFATFEDVRETNPHNNREVVQTRSELIPEVIDNLRQTFLGDNPWNLDPADQPAYRAYTQNLRSNGLVDQGLRRLMTSASAFMTPQAVQQEGSAARVEQAFNIYRHLDPAMVPDYVQDSEARAIFAGVSQFLQANPEADFEVALRSAVAAEALEAERGAATVGRDFSNAESLIDYRLPDPLNRGRRVSVRTRTTAAGQTRSDPAMETRMYASERFDFYRRAGRSVSAAAELASQDMHREFTVWNGQPLRLPPNRAGGQVTAPEQWATSVDAYVEALAAEHGVEDYQDITITHLSNGTYAATLPNGEVVLSYPQLIMAEAGLWLGRSSAREIEEAAADAVAADSGN